MPQSKQGKRYPAFMPGTSQENVHIWSSGKNRGWEQKRLYKQFLAFPNPLLMAAPSLHHFTPSSAWCCGAISFSPLSQGKWEICLRHICQSSSDPPQRLHKLKSLPALAFRVTFPLQHYFLPKIHGRQCFILI